MGKSSSQKGFEQGFKEGSAGEPSSRPSHVWDIVNIFDPDQQKYEDGLEKGHEAGTKAREHQKK